MNASKSIARRLVWQGTLATGGRTAEEFSAEVYKYEGRVGDTGHEVLDADGNEVRVFRSSPDGSSTMVSVHQVRPEYWVRALLAASRG